MKKFYRIYTSQTTKMKLELSIICIMHPTAAAYSKAHKIYHPLIRSYLEKFKYYDIFLVDHETGNIVYSVYKEVDFGTSLA
jgi:hypothetical protein